MTCGANVKRSPVFGIVHEALDRDAVVFEALVRTLPPKTR